MRMHARVAPVRGVMWCDYQFRAFEIRTAGKRKRRKDKVIALAQRKSLALQCLRTESPSLEPPPPPRPRPCLFKILLQVRTPLWSGIHLVKMLTFYGEWLAGRKVMKCDISHNGAVQKSCRVTVKCQHSVNKTDVKWKTKSLNYFCTALNIQTETGLIMASDLLLHFAATPVSPLLALSFSKLCILKARTTKPTVRKYWQTINS